MTLAVCIACGAEKFGAWTPCLTCGFTPVLGIDKAKSLMLSDHNCSPKELSEAGKAMSVGREVQYDPISLADCAVSLAEDDYFEGNYDPVQNRLPCTQCGKHFNPKFEETYCLDCTPDGERALGVCSPCSKICEGIAGFCSGCGEPIRATTEITASRVSRALAVTLG